MQMNYKRLEQLYFDHVNNLEEYKESDEMKKADALMYETMRKLAPDFKEFSVLETRVLNSIHEAEKNGFVEGFKNCMSLFVDNFHLIDD